MQHLFHLKIVVWSVLVVALLTIFTASWMRSGKPAQQLDAARRAVQAKTS